MSVWNSFGSGSWSVATNWIGGVPDAIGATADFSNLANASLTHHIDLAVLGPYTIGTLDLTSSTIEKYSLEHGALTMTEATGASINVTSTGAALASVLAADLKLQMNSATLLTTTGANTTLDIQGMVTGVGELTKAGSGTLKLADTTSNWNGGTRIQAGRIDVSAAALGTGGITFSGSSALRGTADLTLANDFLISSGVSASIRAATGTTLTIAGSKFAAIGGVGAVLHFGSLADTGTILFDPASAGVLVNNPGPIAVSGGTLKAGLYLSPLLALSGGTSIASGATLDTNAFNVTIEHLTGAGRVTNSGADNSILTVHEAGAATFSGSIMDGAHALALYKSGAGTLTLSAVGKYTGGTHVLAGMLLADVDDAIGTAGTLTIDAGATFDLGSSNQAVAGLVGAGGIRTEAVTSATLTVSVHGAEAYDFVGVISDGSALFGDLNLVKNGSGQQTLSGLNTYTGYTSLSGGTLALAAAGSIESSAFLTIFSGAEFDIGGISGSVASLQGLGSSGTVMLGGRALSLTHQSTPLGNGHFVGSAGTDGLFIQLDGTTSSFDLSPTSFDTWNDQVDKIFITGNALANTLHGSVHADTLIGGIGNDDLDGGANPEGGPGIGQGDVLLGGVGDDTYHVDSGRDLIDEDYVFKGYGNGGTDTVVSTADFYWDTQSVGEIDQMASNVVDIGNDGVTFVAGIFDNALYGHAGTDILFGRGGNDIYRAGDGVDYISLSLLGLTDQNAYAGVDGHNTVIVDPRASGAFSYDIVFEFDPSKDKIDVSSYTGAHDYTSGAQVLTHAVDDGAGNCYIVLGDGLDYLYLVGLEKADINAGDFVV